MTNLIKLDAPELTSIEASRAEQIKGIFAPMTEMLAGFEAAYAEVCAAATEGITASVTAQAKRLRLDIAKVRINADKVRKEQKEEYLRAGKAIDGVSNILKWAVEEKENKLKEIEDYFENIERQRKAELQASRAALLSAYVPDASERNLAGMDDDVWTAYLAAKKKEHEDRIAAELQAQKEREAKAKAEAEDRERVKAENERLRKEAAELAAKAEQERKAREEFERAERAKRAALEAELAAKAEQERKAREDAETKLQAQLSANDSEKAKALIADVLALKTTHNNFTSVKHKAMFADVSGLLDKVAQFVEKRNTK